MSSIVKTVVTFGTFDLLHIGHINILKRAKKFGDRLVVGVSSDNLNYKKKERYPVYSQRDRLEIVSSISFVDGVFYEDSLERKREYLEMFDADILVMGDDWRGKFDEFSDICKVIYLPRTEGISTTILKQSISESKYSHK